ncbi:unnamed protein product [Ceratitis capitata]|uniref:(Mediterranean fruit fly) hypothetical protein n=1 Tax=Ceratitis capitata TaxID=7213 RepID=A0A811V4M4_CERCA|nr:unnamed protein product [Ceratitis capitata]
MSIKATKIAAKSRKTLFFELHQRQPGRPACLLTTCSPACQPSHGLPSPSTLLCYQCDSVGSFLTSQLFPLLLSFPHIPHDDDNDEFYEILNCFWLHSHS